MPEQSFIIGTARDIVDLEVDTPPFILDPVLPFGGTGLVIGKRGHGKSQLALTLARALASGSAPLSFPCLDPIRVAYISLDMPGQQVQERLRRLDPTEWLDSVMFAVSESGGIDIELMKPSMKWVRALRSSAPSLVIVDTLHKIHRRNENAAETPAIVFGKLRELFGGDPAFLILHHEGKDSPNPDYVRTIEEERSRGSSAWIDDSDCVFRINKYRTTKGTRFCLSIPRYRYSTQPPAMTLRMNPDTLLLESVETKKDSAGDIARRTLSTLDPSVPRSEAVKALEAAGVSRKQAYRLTEEW